MANLSKDAFAVMCTCGKTKETFGITIDPRGGVYSMCWAFKIKKDQAKREGYDKVKVHGAVDGDPNFNGCPYCGSKDFFVCPRCGHFVCFDGKLDVQVTCPNCGGSGIVKRAESLDISGGGF